MTFRTPGGRSPAGRVAAMTMEPALQPLLEAFSSSLAPNPVSDGGAQGALAAGRRRCIAI